MDVSLLKKVAIGRAAINLPIGSHELLITPVELLQFLDGPIGSTPTPLQVEGVDADGKSFSGEVVTDNVITAKWYPGTSNRLSPPNIRVNERVEIYQLGDSDHYYWRDMGLDPELRKLETVIFAISGTAVIDEHKLDVNNTYFVEFSSHTGKITVSTSKVNGEFVRHLVEIDSANGMLLAQDDINNSISMDSKNTVIRFENADKTVVELNKQDINMSADRNITATGKQNVTVEAGKQLLLKCGGSTVTMTSGNITIASPSVAINQS